MFTANSFNAADCLVPVHALSEFYVHSVSNDDGKSSEWLSREFEVLW
jgi:hypothetical protein